MYICTDIFRAPLATRKTKNIYLLRTHLFILVRSETSKKQVQKVSQKNKRLVRIASIFIFRHIPEKNGLRATPRSIPLAGLRGLALLRAWIRELVVRKAGAFPIEKCQPGRKTDL